VVSVEDFYADLIKDIESNQLVLPTLPEVALKVRDAVEDPNASASQVAQVIGTDAALSARLIQVANSPAYRGRNPIENLQSAIARMGSTVVKNLVTGLVMQQMFQATSEATDARLRRIWEHSTEVAAISQLLAMQFPGVKTDEAMLAGLVHDIGALPILVRAEDMPELLENEDELDELIEKLHTRIGKIILESWGFLPQIIAVAAEHEDLTRDSGPNVDYVDIVQVANIQSYLGKDHRLSSIDFNSVPSLSKLGISEEIHIQDVDLDESISEMQGMLSS
jgi:HD-like signal output (HDOD) protein